MDHKPTNLKTSPVTDSIVNGIPAIPTLEAGLCTFGALARGGAAAPACDPGVGGEVFGADAQGTPAPAAVDSKCLRFGQQLAHNSDGVRSRVKRRACVD